MQGSKTYSGKSDIVFGIVFLSLATLTLIMSSQLADHEQARLSIGQFPTMIGWVMAVLSLLLIGRGVKTMKSQEVRAKGASSRPKLRELVSRAFVLRFVGVAVLGFLYTRVIGHVGYIVATPGLLILAMLLYGEKKWHRLVLIPLVVSFALYHVFRTFFRVPLPTVGL